MKSLRLAFKKFIFGIINHKLIKMKKIFLLTFFLFASIAIGQTKLYDIVLVKAHDVQAYDNYIKETFSKIHTNRIKEGKLLQWDVWKVVDNPQEDFTHMITYIFDMDKYPLETGAREYFDMTDKSWELMWKDVNSIRERVGQVKWIDLGSARKKDIDYLPQIMVLNFMSANPKKWGTYEKTELSNTKSIPDNSLRVGWNFHRRIDDYGSDNYFSHVTIDWYDEYKDFLKTSLGSVSDVSRNSLDWSKLRDLKKRVVMYKFISEN